jgi:2'-5' RNA ligase
MNDIKRLFVAIDLPHEVQVEAHAACAFFEHKGLFKGKCTKAENLHLTLKFIGVVALDQVSIIQELCNHLC